jgi:transcriptional regulator with XRE-family HTH domain
VDSPEQELSDRPGEQLRALRRSREISQRHLAEVSGVDQSVVSRLERGAGALWPTWRRLFSALGYDVVLRPSIGGDEWEDYLESGAQERKDRMEAGRESRW